MNRFILLCFLIINLNHISHSLSGRGFLPFLSSNFLISNAFPASNVITGMEARVAPDAPVKTKPEWMFMCVHVGTFSSRLPAAPERARDEMGSPKIGVL